MEEVYVASGMSSGKFNFNDLIVVETVMGVPDEKRVGRLVQVRKGVGGFGSDVYIIKLADALLQSFSNVSLRMADDKGFEKNFYLMNDRTPPKVEDHKNYPFAEPNDEYTIEGDYPETGFVIENPKQPNSSQQSFGMTITTNC